jgi:lambda family phage portal protein
MPVSKLNIRSNKLSLLDQYGKPINAALTETYESARHGRLINDLPTTDYTASEVARATAERLRGRARHLERNNDIVRRALYLVEQNVIGNSGIKLTSLAKLTPTGKKPDETSAALIEDAWKDWHREPDLMSRYQGFRNALCMMTRRRIVDGEVFVELLPGYRNRSRFSFRLIDPMRVPVGLNREKDNIWMGIEYDADGVPQAYYVDDSAGRHVMGERKRNYRRVPASRMIHYYIAERPGQCRGLSLLASPMERLHMLDKYEEATLTGARIASSKMGFFYDDEDGEEAYSGTNSELTDVETGKPYHDNYIDIEAGQFEDIGQKKFTAFDPGYPPARYEEYTTSILRSISSGLNISYWKLSNDLSDVNYSTAREAKLDDVDAWRRQQQDVIDIVLNPVFDAWLNVQLLTSRFSRYGPSDFDRLKQRKWQPRGWPWVDPQKEMAAVEMKLRHNLTSESIVAEEAGYDFEEILKTRAKDDKLLEQYGLRRVAEE